LRVVIDKRPIWVILVEKTIVPGIYILLCWIFFMILSSDKLGALRIEGRNTLAIFFLCVTLWIGQLIPIGITGLLAIVLLPLLGVMSTSDAYSLFGNQAVFFLIGAFILGAAIQISGLAARIALFVLNRFGNTPTTLLLSIFFFTSIMSWGMPEHVVAAIAFPIVLEIVRSMNLSTKDNFAKILFLSLAWGSITGGVATFLGGARTPLAIGILQETTGKTISFLDWMKFGIPASIALAVTGFIALKLYFNFKDVNLSIAKESIQKMIRRQGLMTLKEKIIATVTILTIGAWIFEGHKIGLANIAIMSVVALFVLQLIRWRDVQENVNWGVILMYGGAIALGGALEKSGASRYVAQNILFSQALNPLFIISILSFFTMLLTAVMSNAAAVAALLPIALTVGNSANIDPKLIALTIAFTSGLDFALPIGTPASAIAYSSGYLKIREMLVPGLIMSFLAWLIFMLFFKYYLPVIPL